MDHIIGALPADRPVLIAGPTASGKSALALAIAEASGGVVVNADALQVFENWRILSARPGPEDEARAPHALYGHVPGDRPYSVGHWLREVSRLLAGGERVIITGGTGLYFTALTQGLADIPLTPPEIRAHGEAFLDAEGLDAVIATLDAGTRERIDIRNPARVMRAWEVQQSTGRGLAAWQDETPPPLLPLTQAEPLLIDAPRDWLRARIAERFDAMLEMGVIAEVEANLASWDPAAPSAKAIGAGELIAHIKGEMSLDEARARVIIATQQYAKRQRTWFRARMKTWRRLPLPPQG